jgi:ubiquinone/menaquinone biosynthesis C-methylase UbiE
MRRFGPRPGAFFDDVYRDTPPWDIGGPQPALLEMVRRFPPGGLVLDIGCGSGDLAIALAEEGHEVLGIDFVPNAIDHALRKAVTLSPAVQGRLEFRVADALHPSRLGTPVRAVVDSGFFHLFDPDEGDRFVAELARTLSPGGRYYLLAFAVAFPIPHSPRGVTIEEVRERFTPAHGWRVLECQPAEFLNRIAAPVPATCVCVERLHDDH